MKLNKLNFDRSVNSFSETTILGHGYSVSFGMKDFKDQIEEDIYPAVESLNLSGYETVTSCHGHSLYNYLFNRAITFDFLGPTITVKVHVDKVNHFRQRFSTWLITTYIKDSKEHGGEQSSFLYVRIQIRSFISLLFSNKYLCQQILQSCNKVNVEDLNLKNRPVDAYQGLTGVEFNHPDFIKQLDPNISDAVMVLNSKGIPTVASCQGHGIMEYLFTDRKNFLFTGPYIVVQPTDEQFEYIIKSLNTLLIKTTLENNNRIWIHPKVLIRFLLPNRYFCNIITKLCKKLRTI